MSTPLWLGPTDQLIEGPESPQLSLSQNTASLTRTFYGTYDFVNTSQLPHGTLGTGTMAGWIVTGCKVNRQRGGVGKMEVSWGATGATSGQTLPADEFSVIPFEVNPSIDRNPRYATLVATDFATVQQALSTYKKPGATPTTLTTLQQDLFNKKIIGETNYYLAGFKYSWTRSLYLLTGTLNVGGFIETPTGPLAAFIPGTFACLRQADDLKWNQSIFKYTVSWLCAPAGHWDPDLYS